MSTIKQKSQKLIKVSKEILDLDLSNSQAIEVISKLEGFNNSNTALNKEKDIIKNIEQMSNSFFNLLESNIMVSGYSKAIIDCSNLTKKDFFKILDFKNLKWNITERIMLKDRLIKFSLENDAIEFKINQIKINNNEMKYYHDKDMLIFALLKKPVQNQLLTNIPLEDFEDVAKRYNIYNNLEKFHKNQNKLNDLSKKKLYLEVVKEVKKQNYSFINSPILEKIGLNKDAKNNFWNHIKKYNAQNLYLTGSCSTCGTIEDISFHRYNQQDDYWFDCHNCQNDYEKSDLENISYHFDLK